MQKQGAPATTLGTFLKEPVISFKPRIRSFHWRRIHLIPSNHGNTLADPNNGPYATTGPNAVSGVQLSHRESRLRQIGDSVADIADLRIKRAQIQDKALVRAGRHAHGAKIAVKARLSQSERKRVRRSLVRSRKLLARVAVMANMILYHESAWTEFYHALHSSGVLGALLDTGETASTATARKALAAARAANNKARSLALRPGAMAKNKHCYWCHKLGHYGRNCPSKKKGEPPSPGSKAHKDREKKKLKKKK